MFLHVLIASFALFLPVLHQVDNQLLGTTQPVMLCVSPGSSSESSIVDTGAALQINSVKVPSNLILTDLFKVRPDCQVHFTAPQAWPDSIRVVFIRQEIEGNKLK